MIGYRFQHLTFSFNAQHLMKNSKTIHVEFSADGCRCAIMAGQSVQQLRLAGIGGRVNQRDLETVRHSGERKPARAHDRIYEDRTSTAASSYSAASTLTTCLPRAQR